MCATSPGNNLDGTWGVWGWGVCFHFVEKNQEKMEDTEFGRTRVNLITPPLPWEA